jgi:valyl-tRNA synthetase
MARAEAEVTRRIESFDFSHASLELYDFVYGELCDWYLELVKPRLRAGEPAVARTLLHVLVRTLWLAHPIIPFVTEEIYAHVPGAEGLLAGGIRLSDGTAPDADAEAELERMIEAVQALRAWRDSSGVRPGQSLPARLVADGYEQTTEQLARLARLELNGGPDEAAAAVPIPGGVVEILPGDGLDLKAAERRRAEARAKLESEIDRAERKLSNQGFVAKAPPEIVATERDKLERLREELEAL